MHTSDSAYCPYFLMRRLCGSVIAPAIYHILPTTVILTSTGDISPVGAIVYCAAIIVITDNSSQPQFIRSKWSVQIYPVNRPFIDTFADGSRVGSGNSAYGLHTGDCYFVGAPFDCAFPRTHTFRISTYNSTYFRSAFHSPFHRQILDGSAIYPEQPLQAVRSLINIKPFDGLVVPIQSSCKRFLFRSNGRPGILCASGQINVRLQTVIGLVMVLAEVHEVFPALNLVRIFLCAFALQGFGGRDSGRLRICNMVRVLLYLHRRCLIYPWTVIVYVLCHYIMAICKNIPNSQAEIRFCFKIPVIQSNPSCNCPRLIVIIIIFHVPFIDTSGDKGTIIIRSVYHPSHNASMPDSCRNIPFIGTICNSCLITLPGNPAYFNSTCGFADYADIGTSPNH